MSKEYLVENNQELCEQPQQPSKLKNKQTSQLVRKKLLYYQTDDLQGHQSLLDMLDKLKKEQQAKRFRDILNPKFCIILPDDPAKLRWDVFMALLLLFVAMATPYNIAYQEQEIPILSGIDIIVDFLFLFDIILSFFVAYFNENQELVVDKKQIVLNYLKGYFIIDILSVFPITYIMNSSADGLARLARLPRLYKLLRLMKLTRMMKILKEKSKVLQVLSEIFKIGPTGERITFFVLFVLLFTHVSSCLWYFAAKFEGLTPDTWVVRLNLQDSSQKEIYMASFYYILTTVTTVGYGDITGQTFTERFICVFLFIFGVLLFSFVIGSLTSVLASMDTRKFLLEEKIKIIDWLRKDYNIPFSLYIKLYQAVKYDFNKSKQDIGHFINSLPKTLKNELSLVMNQELIQKIPFLQQQDEYFLSSSAPFFKAMKFNENEYIYKKGSPVDEIYFIISGSFGLVLPDFQDKVYVRFKEGDYFGDIDFIEGNQEQKRLFTAKALSPGCEVYSISKADIQVLVQEFPDIMNNLFEQAIQRFKIAKRYQEKCELYAISKSLKDNTFLTNVLMRSITKKKRQKLSKCKFQPREGLNLDRSIRKRRQSLVHQRSRNSIQSSQNSIKNREQQQNKNQSEEEELGEERKIANESDSIYTEESIDEEEKQEGSDQEKSEIEDNITNQDNEIDLNKLYQTKSRSLQSPLLQLEGLTKSIIQDNFSQSRNLEEPQQLEVSSAKSAQNCQCTCHQQKQEQNKQSQNEQMGKLYQMISEQKQSIDKIHDYFMKIYIQHGENYSRSNQNEEIKESNLYEVQYEDSEDNFQTRKNNQLQSRQYWQE